MSIQRTGTCIIDNYDSVPTWCRCSHGNTWLEGAGYFGVGNGGACQPCVEGTCDHWKAPEAESASSPSGVPGGPIRSIHDPEFHARMKEEPMSWQPPVTTRVTPRCPNCGDPGDPGHHRLGGDMFVCYGLDSIDDQGCLDCGQEDGHTSSCRVPAALDRLGMNVHILTEDGIPSIAAEKLAELEAKEEVLEPGVCGWPACPTCGDGMTADLVELYDWAEEPEPNRWTESEHPVGRAFDQKTVNEIYSAGYALGYRHASEP